MHKKFNSHIHNNLIKILTIKDIREIKETILGLNIIVNKPKTIPIITSIQ